MKISLSLPDEDVQFLDDYAAAHGVASRSATVQRAVRMLRASGLGSSYEAAWSEWEASGEPDSWDSALSDGIA